MAGKFAPINIIKQTNIKHSGIVIFLHGSGDTGQGIRDYVKFLLGNDLQFAHLQVIYPTAPSRPYTPLNGQKSNVWFDRYDINPDVPENKDSLDDVGKDMIEFIRNEIANGIPLDRICIGGFSMGGCLSLHLAYRYLPNIAGVFALSSFLNKNSLVYEELQSVKDQRKKIPLVMFHGERDDLVPIKWGQNTFENLKSLGITAEFNHVKNTFHELKKMEIEKLKEWINKILPPLPND